MMSVVMTFVLLPALFFAPQEKNPDLWNAFHFFVGEWEGTGRGQAGEATVDRMYQFVLHGQFLEVKNKSVYKPQPQNPTGETHEDWGLFSFDRQRQKFVLRQFHVEGFVNQYVLDSLSTDGKTLVLTTERIENIPTGWRAKETYKIVNANEFQEIFELAAPGKDFEMYAENHFKRKR